jgi:DNA repair protein RecN (Recombination protein N)
MLRRLEIENYGLIPRAQVAFSDGATIFTGETGSGKTMILGALALVLGARANTEMVRRGASRAIVTLVFERDGFEIDDGEDASFVREITDAGKSAMRVNGRQATAGYVREISPLLAEIVGQHEAQRLLSPAYHLELLDRFGGEPAFDARKAVAGAYERVRERARALAELDGDERRAIERFEDARYALEEIAAAAPQAGEDEALAQRRRLLDNIEHVTQALRAANDALAGDDGSASGALGTASAALLGVASMSPNLAAMADEAAVLQDQANELAVKIARVLDDTEFDAAELEAITARLDVLDRLKRKYGGSLDAVLAHAQEAEAIVRSYEARDERSETLRKELEAARSALSEAAAVLSGVRRDAARRLCAAVEAECADLALASSRFEIALEPRDEIAADGAESVELLFSANPGEPVRPLSRVASGGELSRILLALIVALAQSRPRTALVFDEIDAGIGGATATAVGARIGRLAKGGQVMCVTHLAQLATWAQRHYVLAKVERDGAAAIEVREVDGDEARAAELARMLSGESHDAALEHARTLLRAAR